MIVDDGRRSSGVVFCCVVTFTYVAARLTLRCCCRVGAPLYGHVVALCVDERCDSNVAAPHAPHALPTLRTVRAMYMVG